MIKLTRPQSRGDLWLAPSIIATIEPAGASQQWHGVRANVTTTLGLSYEVIETPERVLQLMGGGGAEPSAR